MEDSLFSNIVKMTFPTVQVNPRSLQVSNLARISCEEDRVDCDSGACALTPDSDAVRVDDNIQNLRRTRMEELTEVELCQILKPLFREWGIDSSILDIFQEHEINGHVFKEFNMDDLTNITKLSYGKKKTILLIKEKMIKDGHVAISKTQNIPSAKELGESKFRESLRKFDTPAGMLISYKKSAILSTDITRVHNLLEPVHLFVDHISSGEESIETWLANETVLFAAACMNDRTNGTIHFGVRSKTADEHLTGEVIGIFVDKDGVRNAIKTTVKEHFFEDQIDIVWKCVRPPIFIHVAESDRDVSASVVEIDVVPHAAFLEDEAVFTRKGTTKSKSLSLYKFKEGTAIPELQNEDQIRQYMKTKKKLYNHRKHLEENPKIAPVKKNLRQNFLNAFCGGDEYLRDETYPIIITNQSDESSRKEMAEDNFAFVQLLDPYAVFDFCSSTDHGTLYNYIEEKREQALQVMTTDNFDKNSDENTNDSERHCHLMDDLRTSSLQTWVFANGYDRMRKKEMGTYEWKQERSEGFKEALRYCFNDIPKGRAIAIFLLLSKNYEIMLEAAEDVLSKFHGQWILLAPTDEMAHHWISELLRRNSVDKDVIKERCITGMEWEHVNEMVKQIIVPLQNSVCKIPLSNGVHCALKNKVKNELCDLDILSSNECDDSEILKDKDQKQKHRREVQEMFYRGEKPSWWNYWFGEDQICKRSKHDTLKEYVETALEGKNDDEDKVTIVTLIHQPGAGGTTAARQILWDLRKNYRCCVAKRITDQTCDQIIELRNYGEKKNPRPPVVLLDNCDEESLSNLHTNLERRAREAMIRSEENIGTYCVLLVCTRRTNPPLFLIKEQTVLIRQELELKELEWFQRKSNVLEKRFQNEEGVDPRLLISFNILKENFNFEYIKGIVKHYVDGIERKDEKELIKYLSLINTYDIDFQPLPISSFDALMEVKSGEVTNLTYGLALGHRFQARKKKWETSLSSELKVLLNISSRSGQGNNLKALSIIHPLFAREIFLYLQQETNESVSSIMLQFLQSRIFKYQNRSVDQVIRIVRDVLKKREVLESGKKAKFSRILTSILDKEDADKAVCVLEKGFKMTEDPMIAQQIARLYIHCKNFEKATEYAIQATRLRPNNSYLWDTYGQIFKSQLLDKYETCVLTDEALSLEDTCDIIQVAMKGLDKFHREQAESEQDKNTMQNDAGYFGEVKLITVLMKLLHFSPFKEVELRRFIVDRGFQSKMFSDLNDESRDILKRLQTYTENAMRKIEEKTSQLKENVTSITFGEQRGSPEKELGYLRESVDNIFGENSDDIPAHLSAIESADFRRRRCRRLGGRSLTTLLRLRRKNNSCYKDLEIMFAHLSKNVNSRCAEPYDMVILISAALVMRIINNKESVTSKLPDTLELTKRLYDMECKSKNEYPYLEVFLFLLMFHWPTENRKEKNLCPIGVLREAMRLWKCAFQKNHPRQRDDGYPHRKKETTNFFLGKDPASDEIVYYEELHNRHGGLYFKRDTIWQDPNVVNKLQRLEGTLLSDGLEVLIMVETAKGNKDTLTVPTSMPIGQRSLWQKKVFFYLGFSWAGPKAFDVSSNDRQELIGTSKHKENTRPSMSRVKSQHRLDPTKRIDEIRHRLKKIEKLKIIGKNSSREQLEIDQEQFLRNELKQLLEEIHDVFGN